MSEFTVYDKIEMRPIESVKPYWRNPRQNDNTVSALVKIIPQVGFNVPLFIDSDGVIIKGHARYKAAVKLGMKSVPCIVSNKTDEENRLDRIADNKISELAEWDIAELQYELEQIDFPLEEIGFDVPKDDFYEQNYQPVEYNEVKEKNIEQAKSNLLNNKLGISAGDDYASESTPNIVSKETPISISENEGIQNANVTKKMVSCTCPHCGEKFFFEYNYIEYNE